MLGHASAAMTPDRYADLSDDDLDAVAERLDVRYRRTTHAHCQVVKVPASQDRGEARLIPHGSDALLNTVGPMCTCKRMPSALDSRAGVANDGSCVPASSRAMPADASPAKRQDPLGQPVLDAVRPDQQSYLLGDGRALELGRTRRPLREASESSESNARSGP